MRRHEISVDVMNAMLAERQMFGSDSRRTAEELVENSLQYGGKARVRVNVRVAPGTLSVADDGKGMLPEEVRTKFFRMHSSHRRPAGRNKFGIGAKASAMSAGTSLELVTIRDGIESRAKWGNDSTSFLMEDKRTGGASGTKVVVRGIRDGAGPRAISEKLSSVLRNRLSTSDVMVNGRRLSFSEPKLARKATFRPPPEVRRACGDASLSIGLAEDRIANQWARGICIQSHGVVMEEGFMGAGVVPSSEFGTRLFGTLEWPSAGKDDDGAVLQDRKGMNSDNRRVAAMKAWLSSKVAELLRENAKEPGTHLSSRQRAFLRKVEDAISGFLKGLVNRSEDEPRPDPDGDSETRRTGGGGEGGGGGSGGRKRPARKIKASLSKVLKRGVKVSVERLGPDAFRSSFSNGTVIINESRVGRLTSLMVLSFVADEVGDQASPRPAERKRWQDDVFKAIEPLGKGFPGFFK